MDEVEEVPEKPFISWIDTETICGCIRKNCKHKHRDAERKIELDQLRALTEEDWVWLCRMRDVL